MVNQSRTAKAARQIFVPVESEKVLVEATGTGKPQLQQTLFKQAYDAIWLPADVSEDERLSRYKSVVSMLQGIGPKEEIEGMLATQMVAIHNAAMDCFRRANIEGQSLDGRDKELKHAAKLVATYARQVETLNKHRGKGQQKVTVEHVNVESGGQAIVGNIETGGHSSKQDPRPEQAPKVIANDPGEIIDMKMEDKEPANLRNERDSEGGGES